MYIVHYFKNWHHYVKDVFVDLSNVFHVITNIIYNILFNATQWLCQNQFNQFPSVESFGLFDDLIFINNAAVNIFGSKTWYMYEHFLRINSYM